MYRSNLYGSLHKSGPIENNLILFFTGIERSASEILNDQDTKSKNEDPQMVNNLHRIKEIGLETRKYLEGQVDMLETFLISIGN